MNRYIKNKINLKYLFCFQIVLTLFLFCSVLIQSVSANVTDVSGHISDGQDLTIYGDNFGSASSLFYVGDAPRWTDCTKIEQQSYSSNMSWRGPNLITLHLSKFNTGEKTYLFHANTDMNLNWTVGFPLVVERPYIIRHKYITENVYSIIIEGSGFSENGNLSRVYIGDADSWDNSNVKEKQDINDWQNYYVNFSLNLELLSEGDIGYIYVVDEYGNVSNGYKINLGRPVIESLQYDNESVVIDGSNFFKDGDLIKYDNGESEVLGGSIADSGWIVKTSVNPVYSSTETREGSNMSIFSDMSDTDSNFFLINTDPGWEKIYVSYWFKGYHDPKTAESRNVKPFGLRGYDANTFLSYPQARFDLYPNTNVSNMYISDVDSLNKQSVKREIYNMESDELFLGGGWHRREFYADLGDILQFNSQYTYWRDSEVAGHLKGCFRSDSGLYQVMGINMFYAKDVGEPEPSANFYFDDIYISATQARIEIGDSQYWNDCTHREIQKQDVWTKNHIEFSLHKGSFLEGDQVYIFIVDENGNASIGYPITIDSFSTTMNNFDVNQDSKINTIDAMLTLRNSLGLDMSRTAWQSLSTTGDVNCDNATNAIDSMLLLRYSLSLDMSNTDWCE